MSKLKKLVKIIAKINDDEVINQKNIEYIRNKNRIDGDEISKTNNEKLNIVIQSVPNRFNYLLLGSIGSAISHKFGYRTILVDLVGVNASVGSGILDVLKRSYLFNKLRSGAWENKYGKHIKCIDYRSSRRAPLIVAINNLFNSIKIWRNTKNKWGDDLIVNEVKLNDLIIDTYLRFKPASKFNQNSFFVLYLIYRSLNELWKCERFYAKVKPRLYLASQVAYLEQGIFARVALKNNISCWTIGNFYKIAKKLESNSIYDTNDCGDYKEKFNTSENKDEKITIAERALKSRLLGGVDVATSYMKISAYAGELPREKNLEGYTIIFLHDFFDSPHIYYDLVFIDFWDWICFTIENLEKLNIKFAIKPHPNQIDLSKEATRELKNKYPNVEWLDERFNNVKMVELGIKCGVTMYGSVSHELAYMGVPSIACARNPHHSFSFCKTAKSKKEYSNYLKEIPNINPDKNYIKEESLQFYYMQNLNMNERGVFLRDSYIDLWRKCNIDKCSDGDIVKSVEKLKNSKEFEEFIDEIIESIAN